MSKFVAYVGGSKSAVCATRDDARAWALGQLKTDTKQSEALIFELVESGRHVAPPVEWTTIPPRADHTAANENLDRVEHNSGHVKAGYDFGTAPGS